MDNYDRSNLLFLLNASPDTLRDWWDNIDEDDKEYASELLEEYGKELEHKTILYKDVIENLGESSEYLKKFTLGKKE